MNAYDSKVLEAIRQIDDADPQPRPVLSVEQVGMAMTPPETDLEQLDASISRLARQGHLEADLPPIQQTIAPVTFRLVQ